MKDHIFKKSNARKRAAIAAMAVLLAAALAGSVNAAPANVVPANASAAGNLASTANFSPLAGLAAGGVVQEMKDELADQAAADQNSTDQLTAGQSTAGLDNLPQADAAQADAAQTDEEDIDTYINPVQGYSVRFRDDLFGVEEFNGGEGQTTFYLLNSAAATGTQHGSRYTVSYRADWDGFPDAETYLSETLFNAQMEDPDSYVQMTADPYEILEAGPVEMPAVSWTHYDAESGQTLQEIRAMAMIEGGGCVYFSASMIDEEMLTIADGMGQAVGSFRVDPFADGGTAVTWADADEPAAQAGNPDATVYQADTFSNNGTTYQDDTSSQDDIPYNEYAITHFTPIQMTDGYSYYFTVPEEWWGFTDSGGWGESALLEAYVYEHPEYRMTFWGLQEIPGSTLAAQMSGVPFIMESGSVTSFVQLLPQICALADQSGQLGMPACTRVLSAEILKVTPVSAVTDIVSQTNLAGLITDEAIVEARMILNDGNYTEVKALIYATVAANGLAGFVSYSVMNIYGIFAPEDMFAEIARLLAENDCGELTLHEHYLQITLGTEIDPLIYANSYQQWKNYILSNY